MENVSGKFLIAVPGLEDPNFKHTVVLICEHSGEGAFGIVVNRIFMNSFKPLLKAFELERTLVDAPIYYGGPVKPEQGYIIYSPFEEKYGAMKITEQLAVTASKEVLIDIAEGRGPKRFLFTLGFSGWSANQLEQELMTDSWLVAPLDTNIVFNAPVADRWRLAANLIGVDLERYSNRTGCA